jgi:hypothetical protein
VKPALAETYVEPTDQEWAMKFMIPALQRADFLEENERDLSIEELENEGYNQLLELFAYWLGLPSEQRDRCARQFAEGLAQVKELRDRSCKTARAMLAKQWGVQCL